MHFIAVVLPIIFNFLFISFAIAGVTIWEWKSLHSDRVYSIPPKNGDEYSVEAFEEMIKPQKVFIDQVFEIPGGLLNPGMTLDPQNSSRVYFIYRIPTKGKYERIGWFLLELPTFQRISRPDRIQILGEDRAWIHNLFAEDARIITHNYELHLYYNFHLYKKTFFHAKLHHHNEELYVYEKYHQVYFQREDQIRHEKNWIAFEYCPKCIFRNGVLSIDYFDNYMKNHTEEKEFIKNNIKLFYPHINQSDNHYSSDYDYSHIQNTQLFYVYGSNPFIVVKLYETDEYSTNLAELCFVSEMIGNNVWKWGEIRGGSQALPIDDHYYITFFHTRGTFTQIGIATYVMGAYLFSRHPPFSITHISPEPIVHETFYNESISQWTYKAVDYVIFPMGLVIDDDYFYLSYGRNDRNSWIMKLKRKEFLSSLIPVETVLLGESQMNEDKTDVLRGTFRYIRNSTMGNYVPPVESYIYNYTETDETSTIRTGSHDQQKQQHKQRLIQQYQQQQVRSQKFRLTDAVNRNRDE